jgi:hypothetical protein
VTPTKLKLTEINKEKGVGFIIASVYVYLCLVYAHEWDASV